MSVRGTDRPLVAPSPGRIEIVTGYRKYGHAPVVTIRPTRPTRSGVLGIDDPAVLRELIVDLGRALYEHFGEDL